MSQDEEGQDEPIFRNRLHVGAVATYREAGVYVPVVFSVVARNGRAEAVESTLRAAGHPRLLSVN